MVVDMNVVMAQPGAKEDLERITEAMQADPEASALVEKIHSVEDAYAFVKHYVKVKYEVFKEALKDVANYFKEDKVALKDEVLDDVVGGFSWSSIWNNKLVKWTVAAAVIAVCAVVGAEIGSTIGIVGGPAGFWIGGATGFVAGIAAGVAIADKYIL